MPSFGMPRLRLRPSTTKRGRLNRTPKCPRQVIRSGRMGTVALRSLRLRRPRPVLRMLLPRAAVYNTAQTRILRPFINRQSNVYSTGVIWPRPVVGTRPTYGLLWPRARDLTRP